MSEFYTQDEEKTPFGSKLRERFFLLSPTLTNLNHGSFGATPTVIYEEQHRLKMIQESHPDRWFRESCVPYIDASRQEIANLIHAEVQDVVVLENVSSAINSVLRSLPFQIKDKVLLLSTAYAMVNETLGWLSKTQQIEIIKVNISFPVKDSSEIISTVRDILDQYKDSEIKLCVFSHISSMPTMIEPVKELTTMCQAKGSMVLIDGAHAPGQINIDVKDINAEFYTGNCHKWLYTPKGTAFLYVKRSLQTENFPEPTVISSSGLNDFVGKFSYTGTRDYTALACIPKGIEFRKLLGGDEKIYDYCHHMIVNVSKLLVNAWKTYLLVDESMLGFMTNIVLPTDNGDAVDYMAKQLDEKYNIFIVARDVNFSQAFVKKDDKPRPPSTYYIRLSAQVYLDYSDFEKLVTLVPSLLEEYQNKI